MTNRNTTGNSQAKFGFTMTLDQARKAQKILEKAGIPFDPSQDMMFESQENDDYIIMYASEMDTIADKTNTYLEELDLTPAFPVPETLEQMREALTLAYMEFNWQGWQISSHNWPKQPGWTAVTAKYPALFPQDALQ